MPGNSVHSNEFVSLRFDIIGGSRRDKPKQQRTEDRRGGNLQTRGVRQVSTSQFFTDPEYERSMKNLA